jgi:glyoxylase-like metal-dependent hydrolase (beta-lactamase superfamily II)
MRALSLHRDVIVVTSALLHLNSVIVRGELAGGGGAEGAEEREGARGGGDGPERGAEERGGGDGPERGAEERGGGERGAECFLIDSPVLPEELETLPALIEQAGFPAPNGLLVTHGDWDHLLGRLAFPGAALGAGESTVARLRSLPGEAQRELRSFDEELMIDRPHPLSLGSVQALPVPGRLDVGDHELELLPAEGHTGDGLAIVIGWARVLVAGDYLSAVELPCFDDGGSPDLYVETLERLRDPLGRVDHVVPGHGPVLTAPRALEILEQDLSYLHALREHGAAAELPAGRRSSRQRELHAANLGALRAQGDPAIHPRP